MTSSVVTTSQTTTIALAVHDEVDIIPGVSVAVGGGGDAIDGSGENFVTVDGSLYGNNGFYDSSQRRRFHHGRSAREYHRPWRQAWRPRAATTMSSTPE